MPERKCRFAILLILCFVPACGPQDGTDKALTVAPKAIEKEVLERALADIVARNGTCLTARIGQETSKGIYLPYALSFGDGKLSYAGDPRYDRAAQAWDEAKPLHSNSIQMPNQASRQGFRIEESARADASCLEVRTLHVPRFRDDFAFVTTDLHWKSTTVSHSDVQIFRFRRNRWESFGSGEASSSPVI